jgi:carbon-monoxide dehydrogenase iron sulfur subunit
LKRILVEETLCSGCMACEIACVQQHDGVFGTSTARIRVVKQEANGLDRPHVCQLCDPAPCIESCPTSALYREHPSAPIQLLPDDCIGCGICVEACPYGMVSIHPQTMLALICDLCGGDPACVKRCATGAIRFAEHAMKSTVER